MLQEIKTLVENAWNNNKLLKTDEVKDAIIKTINLLGEGKIRTAEPSCTGEWLVNEWIKKAVALYTLMLDKEYSDNEHYTDDIYISLPFLQGISKNAIIKKGTFFSDSIIIGNSVVETGVYIEEKVKIEAFVYIGYCTQICNNVHICSGVRINDSLERPELLPVIIQNGSYIGPNCVLSEGLLVGKNAILGPNLSLSGVSNIIDVSGRKIIKYKGIIPDNAVVVNGFEKTKYKKNQFIIPAAFIIGRNEDGKKPEIIIEKSLLSLKKNKAIFHANRI
jgi:2,3,4,5-tetrahydropyridine-2-carboxylate N-succinyltransferase